MDSKMSLFSLLSCKLKTKTLLLHMNMNTFFNQMLN